MRGKTYAEREKARTEKRWLSRDGFYRDEIAKAQTPRQKLAKVTDYAKAVGDELPDDGRLALAHQIAKIVDAVARDERSKL